MRNSFLNETKKKENSNNNNKTYHCSSSLNINQRKSYLNLKNWASFKHNVLLRVNVALKKILVWILMFIVYCKSFIVTVNSWLAKYIWYDMIYMMRAIQYSSNEIKCYGKETPPKLQKFVTNFKRKVAEIRCDDLKHRWDFMSRNWKREENPS